MGIESKKNKLPIIFWFSAVVFILMFLDFLSLISSFFYEGQDIWHDTFFGRQIKKHYSDNNRSIITFLIDLRGYATTGLNLYYFSYFIIILNIGAIVLNIFNIKTIIKSKKIIILFILQIVLFILIARFNTQALYFIKESWSV
jgi:hypothetical protein